MTGATGFLGRRLVEVLVKRGYQVRALARRSSSVEKLRALGIQIMYGDLTDAPSLRPAFQDVDVVVHAAADTGGSKQGAFESTIAGTKNILDLCDEFKVGKLIYISSCSVYGVADYPDGMMITEDSSLERYPERRGFYSFGKIEGERLVLSAMLRRSFPIVCLRPGTILGPGGEIFTPMMGFFFGTKLFAIIGTGGFVLPLIYMDNLVEAIIRAIEEDDANWKIFNVVGPDSVTKKDYVERLLRRLYPKASFLYIPYGLILVAVLIQEYLFKLLGKAPFLTRYRLISSQKTVFYDSSRIMKELKYKPPFTMEEAIEAVIASEMRKAEAPKG